MAQPPAHDSAQPPRPVVAVYLRYYLPAAMTFVHRQLRGVAHRYRPIVLATDLSNLDLFPHEPLFHRPRSFADRAVTRIGCRLRGHYAALPAGHRRHWTRLLDGQGAALVHAHFGPYALEILPVAQALRLPLVATFHGFGASVLLRNARYRAQLRDLFAYAHVVAVAHATADRLLAAGADPARTSVVHVGAPTDLFPFIERTPPRAKVERGEAVEIAQVASFVEVKGHRYTLQAFAGLLSTHPRCRLTLAGEGPLRDEVQALAVRLGVADRVRFPGRLAAAQVVELLHASDIFVQPSVTPARGDIEGATTAIAEAMATGLVAVGTRHGGIPELITDGVDGFLAPEGDADGLAAALRSALAEGDAMGRRAARKIREGFDLARQCDRLADIYDRAVDSRSS